MGKGGRVEGGVEDGYLDGRGGERAWGEGPSRVRGVNELHGGEASLDALEQGTETHRGRWGGGGCGGRLVRTEAKEN